jgi:nucleotide-binding universal stress UspA family protein
MSRRLLVPIDGSPQARDALTYACETFPDAGIVVVHVLTPADSGIGPDGLLTNAADVVGEQRSFAEELFAEAIEAAGDRDVETVLLAGSPAREIVHYAAENPVDAIVMGGHGRDGAARLLLGSVSETVVRRSPVPVTVVR